MSIKTPDENWDHLYPPFAEALKKILAQANHETHGKHGVDRWIMFEGFRSQARQQYLYELGRTIVNPDGRNARHPLGHIVTKTLNSKHKSGYAADCYPVDIHGTIMWEAHEDIWAQFGHCVRTQPNMEWGGDGPKIWGGTFVDQPHVQPKAWQRQAWAKAANKHLLSLGLI